jgi:hypothetical protein
MFNSELKEKIKRLECEIEGLPDFQGRKMYGIKWRLAKQGMEIEKLKAIVAELTNTVYGKKK